MREMERKEEFAYVGPGTHNIIKEFGSDVHNKMHFGAPYKWKPNDNPAPDSYNTNSKLAKTKVKGTTINKSEKRDRLPKGSFIDPPSKDVPSACQYQNELSIFGKKLSKMTIQGKKEEKPNGVPAPGSYNIGSSIDFTKPR